MKSFNRLIFAVIAAFVLLFIGAQALYSGGIDKNSRNYIVEAERLCSGISRGEKPDLSGCDYITSVREYDGSEEFYSAGGKALFREVGGKVYRFDYDEHGSEARGRIIVSVGIAFSALLSIGLLMYVKFRIIKPFNRMSELPYELSRGNLTVPLEETKNRYFGKYIWGTDMLRESIEHQKARELDLLRDRQTLLLSISHDIKTPLSAIKLCSKALSKGIYTDSGKLEDVYASISTNADEIERYVVQLTRSAGDDFLTFTVENGECYLSSLAESIRSHYTDRLGILHTELEIGEFTDCLISCDPDRAEEVLQNLMENAIKYGDGRRISLSFSEEEDCRLITVSNTGCTLTDEETIHIFDSFWRGSNASQKPGSGLGLYICRQLMSRMGGSIFARTEGSIMNITAVFRKA